MLRSHKRYIFKIYRCEERKNQVSRHIYTYKFENVPRLLYSFMIKLVIFSVAREKIWLSSAKECTKNQNNQHVI